MSDNVNRKAAENEISCAALLLEDGDNEPDFKAFPFKEDAIDAMPKSSGSDGVQKCKICGKGMTPTELETAEAAHGAQICDEDGGVRCVQVWVGHLVCCIDLSWPGQSGRQGPSQASKRKRPAATSPRAQSQ